MHLSFLFSLGFHLIVCGVIYVQYGGVHIHGSCALYTPKFSVLFITKSTHCALKGTEKHIKTTASTVHKKLKHDGFQGKSHHHASLKGKVNRREEVSPPLSSTLQPISTVQKRHTPLPSYPWSCRKRGQEGDVQMRLATDTNGCVIQAELMQGSGYTLLDEAALERVKEWILSPHPSPQHVTLVFRLREAEVDVVF